MPHDGLALTRDLLGGDTRVSPGQLDEAWSMATADGVALALLRAAVWSEKSEMLHLLRMPRPAVVEPGSEASFLLPITIALAGAALEIASPDTNAPAASPGACIASIDVAPLRRALFSTDRREALAAPPSGGRVWIPGSDHALDWHAAEAVIAERAPAMASWFLLPALGEDGTGHVLRDAHRRWRLLAAGHEPAARLAGLAGDRSEPRQSSTVREVAVDAPCPCLGRLSRLAVLGRRLNAGRRLTREAARTAAPRGSAGCCHRARTGARPRACSGAV